MKLFHFMQETWNINKKSETKITREQGLFFGMIFYHTLSEIAAQSGHKQFF